MECNWNEWKDKLNISCSWNNICNNDNIFSIRNLNSLVDSMSDQKTLLQR